MKNIKAINIVLALTGVVIMVMGLNVGLGGIITLGWLSSNDFVIVKNDIAFAIQNNHFQFLGGVWFAVGLGFLTGGVWLKQLNQTLIHLCIIIAIAGLFRLVAADQNILLSSAILPSLLLEIFAFPLLAFWLTKHRVSRA